MATNNLLNKPAPNYQSFVDNQVLTDDQLNSMLDHLNYQDQLSRVLLSGVGIVCGLEVAFDKANMIVSVSQGAAVTTAGNLMKFDSKDFKAFKPFDDSYVKYAPFAEEDDSTLPLWELETDSEPSDVEPLESFSAFDLEDAVAILYLEDYLEEDEDCSPVNCNTQGRDVVQAVRVLITGKENIEQINKDDTIITSLDEPQESLDHQLPTHYAKRVVLNAVNTVAYPTFLKAYKISFETLGQQLKELSSMSLFEEIYSDSGLDIEQELEKAGKNIYLGQYLYDFYRDLAECYNVLRKILLNEYAICCPNPEAFPKHVLLGGISGSDSGWRHAFYPSPIINRSNSLEEMKKAFRRLLYLIEQFEPELQNEMVITPSRDEDFPLGARAIPYYYNLEDADQAKDFINQWKENSAEWVPNYYGAGYPDTENFEPLDIYLPGHDFYRIEGHLGQNVKDVHKTIKDEQREHGLAFDVVPVAIGNYADEDTINYTKYRTYFEDLQVVLTAWNKEQDCVTESVISFLSKFSTTNIGEHKDYPEEEAQEENDSGNAGINIVDAARESEAEGVSKYEGRYANYRDVKKELEELEKKSKYSRVMKSGSSESEQEYTLSMMKMETGTPISGYKTVEASDPMVNIVDYVDTSSGYMGENWKPIFEAGYAGSHIIADLWDRIDVVLSNVDPDIRKLAGTAPAKLVGLLTDVQQSRLENIDQFNSDNLAAYITAMNELCTEAKSIKKYLEEKSRDPNSEVSSKQWVEAYFYMLNRILANCCITEKVKVLYEKVMERKRELLSQFVLHEFIQKHPGAEHRGGVAKGGTFVLLYLSQLRSFERGDWSASSATTSYRGLTANIPHGTVVGDLCLPYVCCSDTPSTTFVFPETPASLRLPVSHVCMPDDGQVDNIPLTVRPAEGTVKAYVGQRELSGVIVNENGETQFNPNAVDQSDYEKLIRFTVNDQVVEPLLALYEKPEPAFSFSFSEGDFNEEKTAVVVTFENNSSPFNKLSFEWDFGDEVQQHDALKFTHEFQVQPDSNFDFPVTLTATNGPCEASFTDSVNIDVSPLEEDDEPIEDDPDEPPVDDNPDETDEEQQKCFDNITAKLKAAMNLMESELQEHADLLQGFSSQYQQEIQPKYQKIIDSPEGVLGDNASEALLKNYYTFINELHLELKTKIRDLQSDVEREFALKLYYELLLLYFYLQVCRDGEINLAESISESAEKWSVFTDVAAGKYTEALGMLLEVDNIHQKLSDLYDKIGDRFSDKLKEIVEEIIQKLKDFLAEQ